MNIKKLLLLLQVSAWSLFAVNSTQNVLPGVGGQIMGCIWYTNGRPAVGIPVTFTYTRPGIKSGYHYHDMGDGSRPNINLDHTTGTTGGDGCVYVGVIIPFFAGVYQVYFSGAGAPTSVVTLNAIVSGMQQLITITGIAPLSTIYDSGHPGSNFLAKASTNLKIQGVGNSWHNSTYDVVYGGLKLIRMSIPWGGELDISPPGSWGPNADPHANGWDFDMRNPTTVNAVARQAMTNAIDLQCGTGETFPIGGGTLAAAFSWHVTCF